MKIGDFCPAPCFPSAAAFEIPPPGVTASQLRFGRDGDRDFYAVLLNNHPPLARPRRARVAIVGLSPAANQIDAFVAAYRRYGDYGQASVSGAFAELERDIIAMMRGLGLVDKLGLPLTRGTLADDPDIHVTSLVACATLSEKGSSDAFAPERTSAAVRCIANRFVAEMLDPRFDRLAAVVILGKDAERAVRTIRTAQGATVADSLRAAGKAILHLPHPSGQNQEYVKLAALPSSEFPTLSDYVDSKWREYASKPPRTGRSKESETKYKAKRESYWSAVDTLRREIAALRPMA